MMLNLRRGAWLLPILAPFLLAGCVSQGACDRLQAQNDQLQQQLNAKQAHVSRLQDAVKYTVNTELLFPSGGGQLSPSGKSIIGKFAEKLASDQQDKLVVSGYADSMPIGPALQQQGITSNQVLSQKRADAVMQYMVEHGVKPELVAARASVRRSRSLPTTPRRGERRIVVSWCRSEHR